MKFNTNLLKYNNFKILNENSELLFLNSSFCFKNCYQAEFFFKNSEINNIYSRFSNPTNINLQTKISILENTNFCLSTSSGMASIICLFLSLLKSSDYIISSKNLFASTINFFINILFKFKILTRFINNDINILYNNIFYNTKIIFIETPSNPTMEIFDIKKFSYLSIKNNIILVIDNTFCTPILQNPFNFCCDIVLHSCTKFFDGHGRILGGVILTNKLYFIRIIFNFLKLSGFTLSVFNSWLILKSIETLSLRIMFQSENSKNLIKFFKKINIFNIIYHSFYKNYKLYKIQQVNQGSIFSFKIKYLNEEMSRIFTWKILNKNFLFSFSANLGDSKTIIVHPSTTTHNSMNYIEKKFYNINESLIRISVGIENLIDINKNLYICFNNFF